MVFWKKAYIQKVIVTSATPSPKPVSFLVKRPGEEKMGTTCRFFARHDNPGVHSAAAAAAAWSPEKVFAYIYRIWENIGWSYLHLLHLVYVKKGPPVRNRLGNRKERKGDGKGERGVVSSAVWCN